MTEVQELLVILGVIYIVECLQRLPIQAVAFIPILRDRIAIHPSFRVGKGDVGIVLCNPLPIKPTWIGSIWPFFVSPAGVGSPSATTLNPAGRVDEPLRFYTWNEVSSILAEDQSILINDQPFCRVATPQLASDIAARLHEIRNAAEPEREAWINQWLLQHVDEAALQDDVNEFRREFLDLRIAATVLLLAIFLAPALLDGRVPRERWIPATALSALFAWIMILWTTWRVHRRIAPTQRRERRGLLFMMTVAPLEAIRSNDHLHRLLTAGYHPMAAAIATLRGGARTELAKRTWLDVLHPMPIGDASESETASSAESWFQDRLQGALRDTLERNGLATDLLAAPPSFEPEQVAFCPRCHARFSKVDVVCEACGDMPLVSWPTATMRRHVPENS